MSPAPAKTSDEAVITAARELVKHGAFSMQELASVLRISAPALYKRFPDKDAIMDAVVCEVMSELEAAMTKAAKDSDPLVAMGRAYRAFAKRAPALYTLMFADRAEGPSVQPARMKAVAPLFECLQSRVPPAEVLPVARMLTAFLHGFVAMELSAAFRLGGSVQEAFDFGLARVVLAVAQSRLP